MLTEINDYVLNECLEMKDNLASPLLVSSDIDYLKNLKRKILYIGQETNGWYNYNHDSIPSRTILENLYLNLLKKDGHNTPFWLFIKECLELNKGELSENIIWTNTFICGKKDSIGHPNINDKINHLSLEYLTFLYDFFNPDYVIIVNGNNNPYYSLTIEFLKKIKSKLVDTYPNKNEPILVDKNIIWTYHPKYQNILKVKNDNIEKIKKIILK